MGKLSGFVPQHSARRWSWLLLLVVFLAVPFAAHGVPPAAASVSPHATAVPTTADFLASLAVTPAPELRQTAGTCTSNDQCPAGKLCCRDCGYFGCTHMACLTPVNGECPAIP